MLSFPASPYDDLPHESLAKLAQTDGFIADMARTALLRAHVPLLRHYSRNAPPNLREDVEAEAACGFLLALRRFRPDRGVTIGAYAAKYVMGAVQTCVESDRNHREKVVSIFDDDGNIDPRFDNGEYDVGIEDVLRKEELRPALEAQRRWLSGLPQSQREMVQVLVWEERSQSDLARQRNVSRSAINKSWAKVRASGIAAIGADRWKAVG